MWISIVLVIIIAVNFCSVKVFGEMEFWVSSIKVIVLTGVIILMLVLACGGGPTSVLHRLCQAAHLANYPTTEGMLKGSDTGLTLAPSPNTS